MVTSKVLSPRIMPWHWPLCQYLYDSSFGQGIIGAMPIESSETNSLSYPRLLVDANQIKWFETHFFLDFDWCPIEVTITLYIIYTSIWRLGWIALPHSSLMQHEAFHLRRGWAERILSPPRDLNSESFLWPTKLHILFYYGAMNILEFLYPKLPLEIG